MTSELGEGKKLRIAIADDHLIMRAGLSHLLASQRDFELVGETTDGACALRLVEEHEPHVVVMNVCKSTTRELQIIKEIRQRWPQVAVILLADQEDEEVILEGLQAGIACYLIKESDHETLFHAIRTAARGEMLLKQSLMTRLLAKYGSETWTKHSQRERRNHPSSPQEELTSREHEVLKGLSRGERNKEIAAHLGISETTVKTHVGRIYAKLGVDSRASAVTVAIGRGLLIPLKRI